MTMLARMCALNTTLFTNCLEDVTDEQAVQRPSERGNSIAFLAVHVTDARFYLAAQLGLDLSNPFAEQLRDVNSIEEATWLPPVDDVRNAWLEVSAAIERRIADLTADELGRPLPQRFPIGGDDLGSAITFLLQHEMYHIGQMALLRKLAGHPAMRWS